VKRRTDTDDVSVYRPAPVTAPSEGAGLLGFPVPMIHVEVGGSFGGSLRILELQLSQADRSRFTHDVLLYFPTPGMECLRPLARKVLTLFDTAPRGLTAAPVKNWRSFVKQLIPGRRTWYPWLRLAGEYRTARRIATLLSQSDYRLVHVNNTFVYQPATLMAARMAGLPTVSHTRNPVADNLLNRRLARLTDYIATANRHSERHIMSWRSGVTVKTSYEPAACPAPDPSAVRDLRESLLPGGGILIGSIGRLDKQKGYSSLVHAASAVLGRYPQARFAIAGQGPEKADLEALVKRLGLDDRFKLCGFRKDFYNFLAALDLFVCPSLWEGSPLSLVEAVLLGKPVVSTDVGIADDLILGADGELVPPGDTARLAQAILAALENASAAKRRIVETRERAVRMTDPASTMREMEGIFSDVLFEASTAGRGEDFDAR
jgi:glycosyltransferase involved in cell wall biosynthesis